MDYKKLFGKRFREIRKKRGYTQDKIAEIIDLEPQSISKIESGKNFPLLSNLEKIAASLNIGLEEFFNYEHKKSNAYRRKELLNIYDNMSEEERERLYRIAKALHL